MDAETRRRSTDSEDRERTGWMSRPERNIDLISIRLSLAMYAVQLRVYLPVSFLGQLHIVDSCVSVLHALRRVCDESASAMIVICGYSVEDILFRTVFQVQGSGKTHCLIFGG